MGLCRQEYWSGLPFPSPGNLPDPGIKPGSPALQAEALPSAPSGKSISFLELSNIQYDLVPSFAYAAVDCLQGLCVTQVVNVQGTERQMEVPKDPRPCLLSLPLNLWPCPVLPTPVAGLHFSSQSLGFTGKIGVGERGKVIRSKPRDFSAGPVVKNPPSNAGTLIP